MSAFKILKGIDVTQHVEKKGKFNYLSWAWAWDTLKTHCPEATFEKHLFDTLDATKQPYMRDAEGYAYVMVTVKVEGQSSTEIMPVLNHSNKPIQNPNSFDVNTALQRCLVKAIAFTGLGLYIYAGEDLPQTSNDDVDPVPQSKEEEQLRYLEDLCNQHKHNFVDVVAKATAQRKPIKEVIAIYEGLAK